MLGADVCRYRGGKTSAVASVRYGGPKVTRRSRKWVNSSRIVESSWMAVFRALSAFSPDDDGMDRDFEKKMREDSSMGWNKILATSEPVNSDESAALDRMRTRRAIVRRYGIATLVCQRTKAGYEEFISLRQEMLHN